MTNELAPAPQKVSTYGWLCLAAGLLGAVSGIYLAAVSPVVGDDQWSYPLSPTGFTWIQIWFVIQHVGLILGLLAVWSAGVVGRSGLARSGHVLAVGGMVGLTLTEAVAIAARHDDMDTTLVAVLGAVYGVVSVASGIGLVLEGVAARREGVWDGWRGWLLLALGVWVFVPMIPALALSFLGARLAITGWMLLFAALGWALIRPSSSRGGNVGDADDRQSRSCTWMVSSRSGPTPMAEMRAPDMPSSAAT